MNENDEQNIIQLETPVVVPTEEEVTPIAVVPHVEEPTQVAPTIEVAPVVDVPVETPIVVIPEVPVVEEPAPIVEVAPANEIDLAPVGEITTTVDAIESKVEEPSIAVTLQPEVEVPVVETPVVEAPVAETPVVEVPAIEEPVSPVVEATPIVDVPSTPVIEETPKTEIQNTEANVTETPVIETPAQPVEETISAEVPVNNTPAPAGSNKGILIAAILLILIAIGVVVYFLFLKVDNPIEDEPQNTPPVIDVTEEDAVLNYCISLNANNEAISYTEVLPEGCSEVDPSIVVNATTKDPVNKWACCPKIEETPETPEEDAVDNQTEEPTAEENVEHQENENQTTVVE